MYRNWRELIRPKTIDIDHNRLSEDMLAGRLGMDDIDAERVDTIRLQDDIAQIGQGRIVDRSFERLGRGGGGGRGGAAARSPRLISSASILRRVSSR